MPARKVKRQKRLDTSRDDAGDAEPLPAEGADEMSQAWSVLSLSVLKERSPRIISLLVEKGADVNFTNAKGYTPLHTGSSPSSTARSHHCIHFNDLSVVIFSSWQRSRWPTTR